jgi:anti-sigma regulatory factor (Ser/Thr protein kinase)
LHAACEAARAFAEAAGLAAVDADRLCIVTEELLTNVLEHGGATRARLSFALEEGSVSIGLSDNGAPFDPGTAPTEIVRQERGGGAGLALIRAWTNLLSSGRTDGINRLKLSMPLRG